MNPLGPGAVSITQVLGNQVTQILFNQLDRLPILNRHS